MNESENRLSELLADRVVFGLDSYEAEELTGLSQFSDDQHEYSFEIAAALVDLSMTKPEGMPPSLQERLQKSGREAFNLDQPDSTSFHDDLFAERERRAMLSAQPALSKTSKEADPSVSKLGSQLNGKPLNFREIIAWGCAICVAFISLMIVVGMSATLQSLSAQNEQLEQDNSRLNRVNGNLEIKNQGVEYTNRRLISDNQRLAASERTLNQQVAQITEKLNLVRKDNDRMLLQLATNGEEIYRQLAAKEDTIKIDWTATDKPSTQASGDVVWDKVNQVGAMRFVNLEPNDPKTSQYQLWILEQEAGSTRKHPVDGGVFNIDETGEVFVKIDAKLLTQKLKGFAITIESPNGVVVSDQSKLPLVALAPAEE